MKNKLIKIVTMLLILSLIPFSIFADSGDAYKKGKESGAIIGKVWGIRNRNNNLTFNVNKPLRHEEEYIAEYYKESKPSKEYQRDFLEGFKDGFEAAYKEVYQDEGFKRFDQQELGKTHGKTFGQEQGEIDGAVRNKSSSKKTLAEDLKEDKPTDVKLKRRYDLYDETLMYSDNFLETYLRYYERAYTDAYEGKKSSTNDRGYKTMEEQADEDGFNQGKKAGGDVGQQDFEMARTMDPLRALSQFISKQSIESRYLLNSFPSEYRNTFVKVFMESFAAHYNGAYAEYNMTVANQNVNNKRVSGFKETLTFDEKRFEHDSGDSTEVERNIGEIFIPEGAIYQPTHIGLSNIERSFNASNSKYIPVTSIYSVSVINDQSSINLRKPLTLKIPHYGEDKAGIYQLINGSWRYLYSEVVEVDEEDMETEYLIKADIPKGMYRGGQYAVFVDEKYVPISDINISWAKEELYSFMRRGYISGDSNNKYHPNSDMTRGQFAQMIWAVKGYPNASTESSSKFADSNSFGHYKNAIDYMVSNGYMSGYSNDKFGVNDKISYQQIEWVMRKILNQADFNWNFYASKMKNEKLTNSGSIYGKNRSIKKIEAVYMLYELQKNNSI